MSVNPISNYAVRPSNGLLSGVAPGDMPKSGAPGTKITQKDIHKAAEQFEAIIIRQLLSPAIEPVMNGGLTGGSGGNSNGVYGYMLTDALANSMSKGRGMGLASMLEKQFTPAVARQGGITSSTALKLQTPSTHLP